jgi:cytochrome c553
MRNFVRILIVALLAVPLIGTSAPQQEKEGQGPLPWAYGGDSTKTPPPGPSDTAPQHVPDSDLTYTFTEAHFGFGPADWHPSEHGPMPEVVAHGKKPGVSACILCHMPNGKGRASNAPLAGLPVEYFVQQIKDFQNGVRNTSEPRKANVKNMINYARGMSDDEIKAAAEYYNTIPYSISPMPWIKVVESKTAPKTWTLGDGGFLKLEGNQTEPLDSRIIEVPDNTIDHWYLRDDHAPYTAYVPVGSVKKGEELVTTGGGGKTVQCSICHGAQLEGIGFVPGLAGRSPNYLGRQIYDLQHGARKGPWSGLMQRPVEKLTAEDILNICAYIASLPVSGPAKAASAEAH